MKNLTFETIDLQSNKEAMKNSGYKYIKYIGNREHLLCFENDNMEIFQSNKNHASWGLIYKNTHLEFCRSASFSEIAAMIKNKVI